MAEVIKTNTSSPIGHTGAVDNWISQIKAGNEVYDIATHHTIKFFDGQDAEEGVAWNGLTDLEVVIPSLADLVKTPVKFVGTVSNGVITYTSLYTGHTPEAGDVVYVTEGGSFGEKVTEAGDMALYDGAKWRVITGEDQVEILNGTTGGGVQTTVSLGAAAKPVLFVEGKELALDIDYADVRTQMSYTQNDEFPIDVTNGTVTVAPTYVGLTQGNATTKDISKETKISLPTQLTDGSFTVNEKVLVADNFVWDAGVLPTLSMNPSNIAVTASTSIALNRKTGNDFVSSIDAQPVKSVSIVSGEDFRYINSISEVSSTAFVKAIHMADADEKAATGYKAEFSIPHAAALTGRTTFVSGLTSEQAEGALLSSITIGSVHTNTTDSDFLTGVDSTSKIGGTTKDVVVDVVFGSTTKTGGDWFVDGLETSEKVGGQVVTSVSIAKPALASDSGSDFAAQAFTAASVNDHVLSFGTSAFMQPVKVTMADPVIMGKDFTHASVGLTGFSVFSAGFNKGGITQEATTMSFRDTVDGSFALAAAEYDDYVFDKEDSKNYTWTSEGKGLSVGYANVATSAYELINTTISAYVPTGKVVVDFANAGTLPSFSIKTASGELHGAVNTALTTTDVSWLSIDDAKKEFEIPGAYSLTSTSVSGAIEVGAANIYNLDGAIITMEEGTFVADVFVSGTSIKKA